MTVTVRFFASLREELGRGQTDLPADGVATVHDAWRRASGGAALPAHVLAAVNHEYVDMDHAVGDGDEVAFFPPVTGG